MYPTNNKSRVQVSGNGVDIGDEWTVTTWFKELYPKGAWRTLTRGKDKDHQVMIKNSNDDFGTYANSNGDFRDSGGDLKAGNYKDKWHHLAAVGSGGKTKLYVDGVLVGTSDRQSTSDILIDRKLPAWRSTLC